MKVLCVEDVRLKVICVDVCNVWCSVGWLFRGFGPVCVVYVCLVWTPYMSALYVCLAYLRLVPRVALLNLPLMSDLYEILIFLSLYEVLIRLPYMWSLYVCPLPCRTKPATTDTRSTRCLIKSALYVCPYMRSLYVCLICIDL